MNTGQKNKQTILITGSEGSLAQWIISKIDPSYYIVGTDRLIDNQRNYPFVSGDLCDEDFVDHLLAKVQPNFVLHCAAQIYGVKGMDKYSADIISNNLISTCNLAKTSVRHQVDKIIYISSSMVYENAPKCPFKEEYDKTMALPSTGYGVSKLIGETILQQYHHQYGIKYTVWRPFNIITPHERFQSEPGIAHVLTDFIKKIVVDQDPEIEIFGDGSQVRCFSWIDDIATVIAQKSFDSVTDNQIYNVGSETPTTILELAQKVFARSGRQDSFRPRFTDITQNDVKLRIPDCTRARSIGFVCTKTVDDLVDLCVSKALEINGR